MAPEDDRLPTPQRLTDPRLMRALAHPVRLALLETLALRGPLTATEAGGLIGETATTCSFHLRQLARYGFVEEAGGGRGRSRPWRVVQLGFVVDLDAGDVPAQSAWRALASVALARQVARHERSVAASAHHPEPWRNAGAQSETVWWITREELRAMEAEIEGLINRYVDRLADPAKRPPGSQPVEFVALTHLFETSLEPGAVEGAVAGPAAPDADAHAEATEPPPGPTSIGDQP